MKLSTLLSPFFFLLAAAGVMSAPARAKEPASQGAPAATELRTIARKLGQPGFTAAVAESQQAIADWSARIAKGKPPQPLVLQVGPSGALMNIKKSTLQSALGNPTRKTTDSMPALVDRGGKPKSIPVYWYGNVGLGLATGEGFDLGLCMIKLIDHR